MDNFCQFSVLHGSQLFLCNHSTVDWMVLTMKLCKVDQILAQPILENASLTSQMTIFNALFYSFSNSVKI